MVEATGDVDFDALQAQADNLAAKGNQQPGLVGLFNGFRASTPQLYVDIDRDKVKTMGVALTDVFDTLQVYLGGYYVNDFNRFGRTWQVNVQADAALPHRRRDRRAAQGPQRRRRHGAARRGGRRSATSPARCSVTRYNMFPAAAINGASLPGVSTGDVLADDGERWPTRSCRATMTYEWTELSYLQKQAARSSSSATCSRTRSARSCWAVGAGLLRAGGAVRELVAAAGGDPGRADVPALCAWPASRSAGMDVNIFVQVGFVVLVGLACKNAILIVEFARDRQQEGAVAVRRRRGGRQVRLRPIVMTSFAFILGVLPLVIATGAGAEMRRTLGTAVFAGMLGVTLFGIFLTPVFFYVIERLIGGGHRAAATPPSTPPATPPATPASTPPAAPPPAKSDGDGDRACAARRQRAKGAAGWSFLKPDPWPLIRPLDLRFSAPARLAWRRRCTPAFWVTN